MYISLLETMGVATWFDAWTVLNSEPKTAQVRMPSESLTNSHHWFLSGFELLTKWLQSFSLPIGELKSAVKLRYLIYLRFLSKTVKLFQIEGRHFLSFCRFGMCVLFRDWITTFIKVPLACFIYRAMRLHTLNRFNNPFSHTRCYFGALLYIIWKIHPGLIFVKSVNLHKDPSKSGWRCN